ncbi:MAG: hypothetical protein LBT53_08440 [Puniceicoccales bacterium]|jgi:hypothetical protein|nr:hypothetical protein [Puniceicoccales bacterium]
MLSVKVDLCAGKGFVGGAMKKETEEENVRYIIIEHHHRPLFGYDDDGFREIVDCFFCFVKWMAVIIAVSLAYGFLRVIFLGDN